MSDDSAHDSFIINANLRTLPDTVIILRTCTGSTINIAESMQVTMTWQSCKVGYRAGKRTMLAVRSTDFMSVLW